MEPDTLPHPEEYDYESRGFRPNAADMAADKKVARSIYKFFCKCGDTRTKVSAKWMRVLCRWLEASLAIFDQLVESTSELRGALPGETTFSGRKVQR